MSLSNVHFSNIKRWFIVRLLRYDRAIWKVWVILSASFGLLQYQEFKFSSQITSTFITSFDIDANTSIEYQVVIINTIHIYLLLHTSHVQNLQRATQSAPASPHKRSGIAYNVIAGLLHICRSDWQHLDT